MINRFETFSLAVFNIARYWNKIAGEEMKKHGLKGPYAFYLVMMSQYDGEVTAAHLSEMCGKDKADVSRAITAMEKKGFITRKGEHAYRAKLVLTADGKAVAHQLANRATLAVEMAGKGLSDEMRQTFYQALGIISSNLKALSQKGLPETEPVS